jgi:hypothetical protein
MQRRHHYEQAFEEYLRDRRIPYVAVDEARKALLPAPRLACDEGSISPAAVPLKSFDFVIYGERGNLLAEIKGRRVGARLESWVTQDDVDALTTWEGLFGSGFSAAFVFIYWCEEQPPAPLFEELFEHRGRWYAIRVVRVADYAAAMRLRSPKWRTVHLSTADFERMSRPLATA